MILRFRAPALLVLAALLIAGCVSTKKRYAQAFEHEQAGEVVQAAEAYIRVLEKDRNYEDARQRLETVGAQAIAYLWDTAADLESTGAFDLALRELDRMTELRTKAEDVRVILTLPEDFVARRDFYVDAAIDTAIAEANEAAAAGDLERALERLTRARDRYEIPADRASEVDHRTAEALLNLARADMAMGRFKSGYDTALRAVEILDIYDDEFEEAARILAGEALQQGIRGLALVPFVALDEWKRTAPTDLAADLNDAIAFGEMGRRSEFIAVIDPGQTRRVARSMGIGANVMGRGDFRELGEEVGADFVLGGELVRHQRGERTRRDREREARTRGRGGVDTTYTWKQIDITLEAQVAYRVYDLATGEFVLEGTVEEDVKERVERGDYAGNWETLDLTGTERLLFDPAEWQEQERQLMIALSDKVAERLMRQVDDRLTRLID